MRDKWRKISKEVHDNVTKIPYLNEASGSTRISLCGTEGNQKSSGI